MRRRVTRPSEHRVRSGCTEASATRWLWTSLFLTCGAIAACMVLAPQAGRSPDFVLAWLLFLGSSVHVASTGWLFTNADARRHAWERRGRFVWAPLGLVATGMIIAVAASPRLVAWAVLLLLAWQLHHFQKQNLGLVALAGASLGVAALRRGERAAICMTGAAGIAEACAHPDLLQLDLRLPLGRSVALLAAALLAVGVVAGALAVTRRSTSDRPPGFSVTYGVALLFPLPLFVFSAPYAAVGGLVVAHGFQYLLLTGLVAAGSDRRKRLGGLAALGAFAILGGAILSVLSHLHGAGQSLRLLYGAYLGLLASHFVVDAGMWRLRDPFVRSFLSQRVGFLVRPRQASLAAVSVADRSVADIEFRHGQVVAARSDPN